tara:strand:- start:970 stop:1206 length:237 start_codon:yes stop_codon:yes gene_type:complete
MDEYKVVKVELTKTLYFHTGDWDLNDHKVIYYYENGKLEIGYMDSHSKEIIKPYHSFNDGNYKVEVMTEEDGGYIKPE